jgi:thiamine biosynthesis protein ThiI
MGIDVLVHYHEIGLKGRNRALFERALMDNIARATTDLGLLEPKRLPGRVVVPVPEAVDAGAALARIARVYGVANAAVARVVARDFDVICEVAGELMRGDYDTFAVRARVAHSDFPMKPREINEKLGAWLLERLGKRVNLSVPDRTCFVEIVANRAMVFTDRVEGAGGLPVGTAGEVAVLLSAGIDSPVAAARMMRRGARCSFVHFHSQPFTDASSVRNVTEIATILVRSQYEGVLHLVPLAPSQQQIVAACPEPLRTLLYRRMMVRIAAAIGARDGAKALVTGDSLGQVASQTLDNLAAVEEAASMPVLRPLIGLDKLEIIQQAELIGTFEAASAPCQEACVLFEPRRPATKARIRDLLRAEAVLDLDAMVAEAMAGTEQVTLAWPEGPADLRSEPVDG